MKRTPALIAAVGVCGLLSIGVMFPFSDRAAAAPKNLPDLTASTDRVPYADPGIEIAEPRGLYQIERTGIVCVTTPCPMWYVHSFDRDTVIVSDVDARLLENPRVAESVLNGDLIVRGYFVVTDMGRTCDDGVQADRFRAIEPVVGTHAAFHVRDSGIRCVMAPCPSLEIVDVQGQTQLVTDLDLSPLKLDPKDEQALLGEIQMGQWIVAGKRAEVDPGQSPYDTAVVFTVHDLLDRYDPLLR